MALLTPMTTAEAHALGLLYGIDVADVRPIARGSVNSNFQLVTRDGDAFFLRVFEEQKHETAIHEAALLDALADLGVATPRPLPRRDGTGHLAEHAGKPVIVFPFFAGDMLCQAAVDAPSLRALGGALATLHLAGERIGPRAATMTQPFRFGREALLDRIAVLPDRAPAEVVASAATIRSSLEQNPWRGTRTTVIHGDLFRDNVLWQEGRLVALLDFESAAIGCPAFDLMVTLLAWCFSDRLDAGLCRALADGYVATRPLTPEERSGLFGAGVFACDRFAATRITDFELRPPGSVVFKDFRRFLARKRALERLGPDGLASLLFDISS